MISKNKLIVTFVGAFALLVALVSVLMLMTGERKGVFINEVCSKNEHIFADNNGKYFDYIELYNSSDKAIDLTGYGLSDKEDEPYRFQFSNTTIKPGSYLLVMATKDETELISTGFGLDADEENLLFLSDSKGRLIDSMVIPTLEKDVSYGRSEDGGKVLSKLSPSPSVSNQTTGEYAAVEKPSFNMISGFYDKAIQLEISCNDQEATIYYTLDGSIPNKSSMVYSGPIQLENATENPNVYSARTDISANTTFTPKDSVTKANVVRAIAYHTDGNHSEVINGTYFVGLDQKKLYGDAPVISLITDPKNLFDYDTGIYVLGKTYDDWLAEDAENAGRPGWEQIGNFSNKGKDWEREVYFEYINGDGSVGVAQNMGIRIKGNTTRTAYQKSLKLYARKEYGNSAVSYPIIPDNERSDGKGFVQEYKKFVLRNGGNDQECTKYRDTLNQLLIQERDMETQQSIPCVVFLDGEYWGMYTLMEDYADSYFANNYDIDKDNVISVKAGELDEGEPEDMETFKEMYQFITQNDMSKNENYQKATEYLDIQNFQEYCAFQFYIHNQDAINNWGFWRVRDVVDQVPKADGKWRMYLFDTEYSDALFSKEDNSHDDNISSVFEASKAKEGFDIRNMLQSLYKNEQFKKEFINTMCDIRNYDFEKEHVMEVEKTLGDQYEALAIDSIDRNGPEWVLSWQNSQHFYEVQRQVVRDYFDGRYECFTDIFGNVLELGESSFINISVSDTNAGTVQVNNTELDLSRFENNEFTGTYFKDYEVSIKAIPKEGYRFVKWEVQNGNVTDAEKDTTQLQINNNCKVVAVFE